MPGHETVAGALHEIGVDALNPIQLPAARTAFFRYPDGTFSG